MMSAESVALDYSLARLDADGNVVSASTTIYHRIAGGVYRLGYCDLSKTIVATRKIDYSNVTYVSGAVSGGTIKTVTTDGRGRARAQSQVSLR